MVIRAVIRALFHVGVVAFLAFTIAPQAKAACTTALVLGLDVSSSVDDDEYALQVGGVADAFRSTDVHDAILPWPGSGIMVSVFEWSGVNAQRVLVDWTWLASRTAILAFADQLEAQERVAEQWPTALGRASAFGARLQGKAPRECQRRVIDISGDGVNNDGLSPDWYRERGDFDGLVINGLVIRGADPDPVPYYQRSVIHGTGAFVEVAESYDDYRHAIERKLVRELSAPVAARSIR